MQDIVDWIKQHRPHFEMEVEGATAEEVARLADLCGRPLPETYREFLTLFGRKLGPLEMAGVDFSIDAIARIHRQDEMGGPPRYLVIGEETQDPYFSFFLDLETNPSDPMVVRFEADSDFEDDERFECNTNLREMVFGWVILCARIPQLKHHVTYYSTRADAPSELARARPLEALAQVAMSGGMRRLDTGGPWAVAFEREDCVVLGYQRQGCGPFVIEVGIGDTARMRELGAALGKHLGVMAPPLRVLRELTSVGPDRPCRWNLPIGGTLLLFRRLL